MRALPPTPWRYDDDAVVWSADDFAVATIDPENERDGKIQARIGLLVAAAPELLEKAEAALQHLDSNRLRCVPAIAALPEHEIWADLRAAVAKARGES